MDGDKNLSGILNKLLSNIIDAATSKQKDGNGRAAFYSALFLGALLLLVGTEPPKLIFRKRIGKFAIGLFSAVIASIIYGVYAWFLYSYPNETYVEKYSFDTEIYILTGGIGLYAILSLFTIIKALKEYFTNNVENGFYRGDSILFIEPIEKGKISRAAAWAVAEPLTFTIISIILYFIHPFLAYPLLITSLSFWINELYEVYLSPNRQKQAIIKSNLKAEQTNSVIQGISDSDKFNHVQD